MDINFKDAPRLNLTKEDIKLIMEKYNKGITSKEIESQYNLFNGAVGYLRRKYNIPIYMNDQLLARIVKEHINGKLMKDIEKEYNISHPTVYKYMKKNNINYKNEHGRKYNFNQNYFETINTEDKAYWLGFIYADGCISKTDKGCKSTNRLQFIISIKDIELLENFCNCIDFPKNQIVKFTPIGTYSTNEMCKVYINSTKMCNDLEKLGVVQNKTLKLNKIPNIPSNLIRHFIRGVFDGDGNITTGPSFRITGDKLFLLNIQNVLIKFCNLNKTKLYPYQHKDKNTVDLGYGGILQVRRIFNFLYNDSTIFLERKYNKFIKLIS